MASGGLTALAMSHEHNSTYSKTWARPSHSILSIAGSWWPVRSRLQTFSRHSSDPSDPSHSRDSSMSSSSGLTLTFLLITTLVNISAQLHQDGASLLEPKLRPKAPSGKAERRCPGTCLRPGACSRQEGVRKGDCIDGTICCQFERTCDQESHQLVTFFQSPNFSEPMNASVVCPLRLSILPQVTALRIDFETFELDTPQHLPGGFQRCVLDTFFVINGKDGPTQGLCAMANYSSVMYVKETSNLTLLFVVQSQRWRWRLKLTQLNATKLRPWANMPECGRQLLYEDLSSSTASNSSISNHLATQGEGPPGAVVLQPFIVNGENASGSEFPWQVSIQVRGAHRCGGSIINNQFILTAAHCFADSAYFGDFDKVTVVVGAVDLDSSSLESIPVEKVIVHHDYKPFQAHLNDIALLKLTRDIRFSSHSQPVCLPTPPPKDGKDKKNLGDGLWDDEAEEGGGPEGLVSGWGRLNGTHGTGAAPTHLQKLSVRLLTRPECERIGQADVLRLSGNLSSEFSVHPTQICALAPPNSTVCFGDSGGALVVQSGEDGTFAQVGVVSFGLGPCLVAPSPPVVYTKVQSFLNFIALVIQSSSS